MSCKLKKRIMITLGIFTIPYVLLLTGCQQSVEPVKTNKIVVTSSVTPPPKTEDKLLIVTSDYAPYVGENIENQGFLTQMIEEALKTCGFEYEIKFYPWARCREMVENGQAWATYPYGHSEDNDEYFLFSSKIYSAKHKFYYRKDNKRFNQKVLEFDSIDDFEGFVFGGANGYWYGNRRDIAALSVKVEWAKNTDALVKMLYAGRIDFMIEDELVCEDTIQRLFPEDEDAFATLRTDAKLQDYYLLTSKKYPNSQKLLDQFNEALNEIRTTQKLQ